MGAARVVKSRTLVGATGIAVGGGHVYVASRSFLTVLEPRNGTLAVAQAVRPRGVSGLTAVTLVGSSVYVAGHGLAVLRLG